MDKKSLRLKLFSLLCQFESIKTDKGELVVDKTLEEGVEAYIGENPAEDGEYVLEDERIVVIKDGKVAEIKEKEVEEEKVEEEEVKEDVKEDVEAEEVKEEEVVEEEVKEETTEEEVDVEALKKENEELKAKIVELEEKIKELNEKPVDVPIDQTVDGSGNSLFSDDKVKRNPALRYFQD
jgi:predicted RNase H-like nuclease (RuvC/YqgF family)